MTFQPYEGPATFDVAGAVYRIPRLRLELQESTLIGHSDKRAVVAVLERGELPKDRTHTGELRLGDQQELTAWWRGSDSSSDGGGPSAPPWPRGNLHRAALRCSAG